MAKTEIEGPLESLEKQAGLVYLGLLVFLDSASWLPA